MSATTDQYKLRYIPLDQIELWPDANARRMDVNIDIDELAANIQAIGLQNPIVVQEEIPGKKYYIISGQRRWLACRKLGYEKVPCMITPKMNLVEAKIASLSENLYRGGMNPQDTSDVVDYLFKKLGSIPAVAKRLGVSPQTVTKYIGYSKVPQQIKDEVNAGHLTVGQAMSIYSKFGIDEEHAIRIAKRIASIKDKTEKRALVSAAKSASPREDFDTLRRRAKEMKEMIQYTIHLPPRTSVTLEKVAKSLQQDPEDVIIEAVEKWLDDHK